MPSELSARLDEVRRKIADAARRSGRLPEAVQLVVVTKTHSAESVKELFGLGHRSVGENKVQEALAKINALPGEGEWHMIGHLQRNKAAQVVGRFDLIHSVDSVRLIEELAKQAEKKKVVQRILLELNVAGEEAKTGALAGDLPLMIDALARSPHLRAEGLMTMAPYNSDPESARLHFRRLREILENTPAQPHFTPRHLSMGMSGDYEVAIEEGSTIVRIGTAIMGERE